MKLTSIAILIAAFSLTGCTLPNSTSSAPVANSLTGNWELTASSTTGAVGPIGIYLTQSGSTVSGIAFVQMAFPQCIGSDGVPCSFPFGVISRNLTGTIDPNGNITLGATTGGIPSSTFSMTATTTNNSTLSGTYSISLPPASDSGTITGNIIAPLNGTYAGTVVSSSTGLSMGVTTTLSQTTTPDATGALRVTETATTFTGSSCFTTVVMQGPPATYSGLIGNGFTVNLVSTTNANTFIIASGGIASDAKTIQFHYDTANLPGSTCKNDYGGGTLTLQ